MNTLIYVSGDVTEHIVTGLTNGINYEFYITATNLAGSSLVSNTVSATPRDVSSAPRNLQAIRHNVGVKLTWNVPMSDGGDAINSYTIFVDGNAFLIVGSEVTEYVVNGLPFGVSYEFSVLASNSAGNSLLSNSAHATPLGKASAPVLSGYKYFFLYTIRLVRRIKLDCTRR